MAIKLEIAVEMEDGTTYTATADQRDIMRYEIQPFAGPIETHGHTFTRFVAFSALDRVGALKGKNNKAMGWEAFNAACIEARDVPEEMSEDETPKG
jgi:hypothetical protein